MKSMKIQKWIAWLVILAGIHTAVSGQLVSDDHGHLFYPLANYRIYPEEKKIKIGTPVGGVSWEGYAYLPAKHIDYDKTTLVFIDRQFYFKEDLNDVDLSTLQVLYEGGLLRDDRSYYAESPVFIDKHAVYYNGISERGGRYHRRFVIPEHLQQLNRYLWQDQKGKLYLVPRRYEGNDEFFTQPIEHVDLDPLTLRHVGNSFYTDKNGLYWLAPYFASTGYRAGMHIRLEESHGKALSATIHGDYVIYGEAVYPLDYTGITPCTMTVNEVLKKEAEHKAKMAQLGLALQKSLPNSVQTSDIDFNTVDYINRHLFVDQNNIYTVDEQSRMVVIPRNQLGFAVLVFGTAK